MTVKCYNCNNKVILKKKPKFNIGNFPLLTDDNCRFDGKQDPSIENEIAYLNFCPQCGYSNDNLKENIIYECISFERKEAKLVLKNILSKNKVKDILNSSYSDEVKALFIQAFINYKYSNLFYVDDKEMWESYNGITCSSDDIYSCKESKRNKYLIRTYDNLIFASWLLEKDNNKLSNKLKKEAIKILPYKLIDKTDNYKRLYYIDICRQTKNFDLASEYLNEIKDISDTTLFKMIIFEKFLIKNQDFAPHYISDVKISYK